MKSLSAEEAAGVEVVELLAVGDRLEEGEGRRAIDDVNTIFPSCTTRLPPPTQGEVMAGDAGRGSLRGGSGGGGGGGSARGETASESMIDVERGGGTGAAGAFWDCNGCCIGGGGGGGGRGNATVAGCRDSADAAPSLAVEFLSLAGPCSALPLADADPNLGAFLAGSWCPVLLRCRYCCRAG